LFEDYLDELMPFPRGRNDDQVDSTLQGARVPHGGPRAMMTRL
jgi:phage terminase large subunit-like protein